jgi:hypothetical protein
MYLQALMAQLIGRPIVMAEKKVPGVIHIHVDDVNSLRCKTLLAYCGALHYRHHFQADKDVRRSMRAKLVVGEPRIVSDEID